MTTGYNTNPHSSLYGQRCTRHERDPFNPMKCWKCSQPMRAPAMRGGARKKSKKKL